MADLPQQSTITQYTADGATIDFVGTFYVPVESDGTADIDVYVLMMSKAYIVGMIV